MSHTILSYGEVLWDLLPDGPMLGGAPCNFAYRVNELGHRGLIGSRVGADERGEEALRLLAAAGVGTALIQRDPTRPTGTVRVSLDEGRNPDYLIVPEVAYDAIAAESALLEAAGRADCLCFGTLIQRSPVSRATLAAVLERFRGKMRILDVNLRKDCWTPETVRRSLAHADILKLNDGEARALADALRLGETEIVRIAKALLLETRLSTVVITLGPAGCFAASRKGWTEYAPGFAVDLADPVGSGDAFTAAFAVAMLDGRKVQDACRHGNALGACVAARHGPTAPVPAEELERMLREGTPGPKDPRF